MANFTELVKYQKSQGKGNIGSLGAALGQKTLEKLDPRNLLFSRTGLATTLFPSLKGYRAQTGSSKGLSDKKTISEPSPLNAAMSDALVRIDTNTKLTAKNSLVLPMMARDMNLMRLNMQKLVRVSGETPSRKADMFFKRSSEREAMYESQFGKNKSDSKVSKADGTKPASSSLFGSLGNIFSSILGLLIKGGLFIFLTAKLGELISNLITDKEFRERFFQNIDNIAKSIFGEDIWKNLAIGVTSIIGAFTAVSLAMEGFKRLLFTLIASIGGSLFRGLPGRTVPGVPGRTGPRGKPGAPKGGKFGKFGLMGLGAAALGAYMGYQATKDDETEINPETGEPVDQGMTGMQGAATGAAVVGGTYAAKSLVQPKLDARVQSKVGDVSFNEKTQRYMKNGKMVSAKNLPLTKTLEHLRNYYTKVSKVPGFRGFILRKITQKFGMGVALRLGTFLAGLAAAPFTAGLSTIISLASWGLTAVALYELYDWLFGEENNADALEKAFQLEQTKQEKKQEIEAELAVPEGSSFDAEMGMGPTPVTPAVSKEALAETPAESQRRMALARPAPIPSPPSGSSFDAEMGTGTTEAPTSPTPVSSGISDKLVNFVKAREGFSAKAHWDYKQYSNGYGTKANSPDEVIDKAEAERRLRQELEKFQKIVVDYGKEKKYNWNQDQVDGLTSFIYNLGPGALKQVTANGTRSNTQIAEAIVKYNKAGGKELSGLTARRNEELAMFTSTIPSTGSTQVAAAPSAAPSPSMPSRGEAINVASTQVADARTAPQQPVVVDAKTINNNGGGQQQVQLSDASGVADVDFASLLMRRSAEGALG